LIVGTTTQDDVAAAAARRAHPLCDGSEGSGQRACVVVTPLGRIDVHCDDGTWRNPTLITTTLTSAAIGAFTVATTTRRSAGRARWRQGSVVEAAAWLNSRDDRRYIC